MTPQQLLQEARTKYVGAFNTSLLDLNKTAEFYSNMKYSKPVTSPEQFVPMWCCMPKQTRADLNLNAVDTNYLDLIRMRNAGFVNFATWLESKPIWVRYLVRDILTRCNGSSHNVTTYVSHIISNPVRADYLRDMRLGMSRARSNPLIQAEIKGYVKTMLSNVHPTLFDFETTKCYTLPLPHLGFRMPQLRQPIEEILTKAVASTEYRQLGNDPETFVVRQGYLGKLGSYIAEPQQVHVPLPTRLTTREANSQHTCYPQHSAIFGLQSYYCLMIKAKYQTKVMWTMLVGNGKLELPAGAVELWEEENIRKKLSGLLLQTYTKQVYGLVRNNMQCTVRTVPDLTRELFDIEREVVTPNTVDRIIAERINRGGALAAEHRGQMERSNRFLTYKRS